MKDFHDWVTGDSWTREDDLEGVDHVADYQLIADGEKLTGSKTSEGTGTDEVQSEGFSGEKAWFPEMFASVDPAILYSYEFEYRGVPECIKEIHLRPVYSVSGEHPEEDLTLKITD